MYITFLLILTTGMQQAEILGLRWWDVDLETGLITIKLTLSHEGRKFYADAKNKQSLRSLYVPHEVVLDLQKHRRMVITEKLAAGSEYIDHDLIVCTKKGTPVSPLNVLQTMSLIIKKEGIDKLTFHDQRHAHATMLLADNFNGKFVSERLGHTSSKVTLDIYGHVTPGMQKESAEATSRVLFKQSKAGF